MDGPYRKTALAISALADLSRAFALSDGMLCEKLRVLADVAELLKIDPDQLRRELVYSLGQDYATDTTPSVKMEEIPPGTVVPTCDLMSLYDRGSPLSRKKDLMAIVNEPGLPQPLAVNHQTVMQSIISQLYPQACEDAVMRRKDEETIEISTDKLRELEAVVATEIERLSTLL